MGLRGTTQMTGCHIEAYRLAGGLLGEPDQHFQDRSGRLFSPQKIGAALSPSWGPYVIIRRLPATEGEFQYVIRSANEDHERVARESELSRF